MMAKKKTQTPADLLAAALVPKEAQPYEIPANWQWVRLEHIAKIRTGKKDANYGNKNGQYPFFTCAAEPIRCENYSFDCDAILLAGNGDIGNISRYNGKFEAYQRTYVLEILPPLLTDFVFYSLKLNWVEYNRYKMYGTAIPYIRLGNLKAYPVPLPPLAEQARIVARIETLFARIDEAEEKLRDAADTFAARRAALLHAAFTGRLTAVWRTAHGRSLDEWERKNFSDVAEIKSNLVNPAQYPDFPHIAPDNIEKETGKLLEYHTIAEDGVKSGKHRFYAGQILYSKIRPYLSKVVVVDFDGLCSADMYPIQAKGDTKYLWYYMLSADFLAQVCSGKSRTVLPKINQKELAVVKVNIPPLDEQREIVRLLDEAFAEEERARQALEAARAAIPALRRAILARAFRGALGTGDPAEAPADLSAAR